MQKRWTALVLSLAMAFALGAPRALADGVREGGAQTFSAQGAAAQETAAPNDDTEKTPPEDGEAPKDAQQPENAQTTEGAQAANDGETAENTPEGGAALDAEGTLTFENLRARMLSSYYPLRILQESIDDVESHDYDWRYKDLRSGMNELATMQWMLTAFKDVEGASMLGTQSAQMRKEYEAIEKGDKQKEDTEALWQYRSAQNQTVVAGEALYITLKNLEAQDAALARKIAQLGRSEKELQLRYELGQVSALAVAQVSAGRTQAVSGRKTLEMNRETALLQLKSMTGAPLDAALSLGALPKVTAQELDAMDLEADLAKAKEASYALFDAKKQVDDFRKDVYDKVIEAYGNNEKRFEVSEAKHGLQAMQYQYENKVLTYELNFRTLYAQVKDAAQVLSAKRAALAEQERSYAVSALKFEQGNLSANAFADAKDDLSAAKDDVSNAERELFSQYRTYMWAVEYGILNA